MKKVEKQIKENPTKEVVVRDIYGKKINLGVQPRLLFGGEESGGMIIGPEKLIQSLSGRLAIAMREKSATEAIIIASAMIAILEQENIFLSDNLEKVFESNEIIGKFDVREDIAYYNESEPDIEQLKIAKKAGETLRTKNDLFYLSMAIAKCENLISVEQIKEILEDVFPSLNFSNLKDIKFVGDGTFLEFEDKYIEIRPSGTDAKTKAYGAGLCKDEILKYAKNLGNYSGERTTLHKKFISEEYYEDSKHHSQEIYQQWANEDANNEVFCVPDYCRTFKFLEAK
jgi:phosphomannomutase